jgi:hypothetical protein
MRSTISTPPSGGRTPTTAASARHDASAATGVVGRRGANEGKTLLKENPHELREFVVVEHGDARLSHAHAQFPPMAALVRRQSNRNSVPSDLSITRRSTRGLLSTADAAVAPRRRRSRRAPGRS